jgi:hypothetical protein
MKFVNAFQKIGLTVAAVVFAFSALIYTINPAQADAPATTAETGKIMMHQNSFVHKGFYYFHVLVWDTNSGKSKVYNFNTSSARFEKAPYQLPSSPLY